MPRPPSASPPPEDAALVITEVKITPQSDGALRAFASITLNGCFVVRGLKVIDGMKGRFVAMPSRQRKDGTYQDIAHPITREFRAYMEECVLSAFRRTESEEPVGARSDGQVPRGRPGSASG